MEMIKTTGFCEMTADEMQVIDGGLFGIAWLTGALCLKIIGAGITVGAGAAGIYYATK